MLQPIRCCLALLFCGFPMVNSYAQEPANAGAPQPAANPESDFEARVFTSAGGRSLPYRLLHPLQAPADGQRVPLVLFLHGAGERGDDNARQLIHGAKAMAGPDFRRRYPCYVLMPQCPAGKRWVEVAWDAERHARPEEPSESMALVFEIIDALREEFSIDESRIYATGLSMGGYGVWDILARRPEMLAAAAPICGGGDPAFAGQFKATPVWAFHGDADAAVNVRRSREMIDALRAAGGRPLYTEYEGVGHDSWTATFNNRLMWDWMFAQRK
jgi:predicted peptidase